MLVVNTVLVVSVRWYRKVNNEDPELLTVNIVCYFSCSYLNAMRHVHVRYLDKVVKVMLIVCWMYFIVVPMRCYFALPNV